VHIAFDFFCGGWRSKGGECVEMTREKTGRKSIVALQMEVIVSTYSIQQI
jgi:hypothetical protein